MALTRSSTDPCDGPPALAGEHAAVDLAQIDRSIVKEPRYVGTPHYALIVVGPRAEHRSWLVMDGDETLYFDRNGNGDLTEPEDKIGSMPKPPRGCIWPRRVLSRE